MQTITRKTLKLKSCPHCGGDVCRMRDTFGVYHQCAQCGREIRRATPSAPPTTLMDTMTVTPNPTHGHEQLVV